VPVLTCSVTQFSGAVLTNVGKISVNPEFCSSQVCHGGVTLGELAGAVAQQLRRVPLLVAQLLPRHLERCLVAVVPGALRVTQALLTIS
jgi:hypothetical protein